MYRDRPISSLSNVLSDIWHLAKVVPVAIVVYVFIVLGCTVILSACSLIDLITGNKGERPSYFNPDRERKGK